MASSGYKSVQSDIKALLTGRLGPLLANITDGRGPQTTSEILGTQLTRFFETYGRLRTKLDDEVLDCAVLALAKSGKSTLLNAFLGAAVLPSSNVPETARIVSVEHAKLSPGEKPCLEYRDGFGETKVVGEDEIRAQLEFLNGDVRGRRHRKEDENILTLKLEIAALEGELSDSPVRLRLLDTPGPNEAGEDALRHQVERLLDSVDAVIYVLDYTKLKTNEEAQLLAKLKDVNPGLVARLAQRLFFVVNKVDQIHHTEGLDEEQTQHYVADLITRTLNTEAFQLKPEQVILVSAQDALLSRLVLLGKAKPAHMKLFKRSVWGTKDPSRQMGDAAFREVAREEARRQLDSSHLPELESRVLGYLYNHAGGLKLTSLLDDVIGLLSEVQNVTKIGQAALKQSADELLEETQQLQINVDRTLDKFRGIQADADIVEQEIVDNVTARMHSLQEKLFAHIAEVLNAASEPTLPSARSGMWRRAWDKMVRLLPFVGAARDDDQERLRGMLQELHADINSQIEAEIQDFWHQLEVSVNEKQAQMIGTINVHLTNLARDIEGVVGSCLDLQLQPVNICMEPPTAQEFHESLQQLFKHGIGSTTFTERIARKEEYTVWEKKYRGICNSCEYYEGRPETRTVHEDREVTAYELHPEAIKEHFAGMVKASIGNSIRHVRSYVKFCMSSHIRDAQERIKGYGRRYTETMEAALNAKTKGAEEQEQGARTLQSHLDEVSSLLDDGQLLMQKAMGMFPGAREAGFCWVPEMELDAGEDKESEEFAAATTEVLDSAQEMTVTSPKDGSGKTASKGGSDIVGRAASPALSSEVAEAVERLVLPQTEGGKELDGEPGKLQGAGAKAGIAEAATQTGTPLEVEGQAQNECSLSALDAFFQQQARAGMRQGCLQRRTSSKSAESASLGSPLPNEKAVQTDLGAPPPAAAEAPSTVGTGQKRGHPAPAVMPPPGSEMERFLEGLRVAEPLPTSSSGSELVNPLGVLSGSTTISTPVSRQLSQSAVLPAEFHESHDGSASDAAAVRREPAIMRAASEDSEWEHLGSEDTS